MRTDNLKKQFNKILHISIVSILFLLPCHDASAARIKDLANISGVRDNQLVGYGLVVGLDGTGDKIGVAPYTQQTFRNMLNQFGIKIPVNISLESKNIAAVAITAKLPPFSKIGQTIDITVASLGNATSLRGGELLMTELRGADNQVYAVAQGSVVVSGFGAQGSDGSKVTVNSTSSGRIPNGATVETLIEPPFVTNGLMILELMQPDFTTAQNMSNAINSEFKNLIAKPIDASSVKVNLASFVRPVYPTIVSDYKEQGQHASNDGKPKNNGEYVKYIARIENISIPIANGRARIIANSRTGTIVIDQNVIISPVAVSHGNLSVVVSEKPFVSQPNAFANGHTVKGSASDISINQQPGRAFLLETGTSLRDLVDEMNRVGAAPGDIISILEAVKAAGALHADLEII